MNLLKFILLFNKIKIMFSYLPTELQLELVDDMEDYYQLCLIAKIEKMKGAK